MAAPAIEVEGLTRRFGSVEALRGISLEVAPGEIHALLGPNGAGKTTVMRVLSGLADPSEGTAYVLDRPAGRSRELRALIGFVPSGDRTFYLRLSALENLAFFGRLQGMRLAVARERAVVALGAVGLAHVARRPVNAYSHGMQKRLSFARALLATPRVLLVDEATHDLDPLAAEQIRALAAAQAADGVAVLWATQRIEELHGFAERVSVLDHGRVAFAGTVAALTAAGGGDRYLLGLGAGGSARTVELGRALGGRGRLEAAPAEPGHATLTLAPGVPLGAAIAALSRAGAIVESCRDERPPIERAFLAVTRERAA
jgi:ABC-type multidrug transport system ATPase subunit